MIHHIGCIFFVSILIQLQIIWDYFDGIISPVFYVFLVFSKRYIVEGWDTHRFVYSVPTMSRHHLNTIICVDCSQTNLGTSLRIPPCMKSILLLVLIFPRISASFTDISGSTNWVLKLINSDWSNLSIIGLILKRFIVL